MIEHTMFCGPPIFPVFNDGLHELVDEPVTSADIVTFIRSDNADMNFARDAAWSSGCEWYFVILPEGIAFWNVYSRNGLLCTKHTFRFIERCFPMMGKTLATRRRR